MRIDIHLAVLRVLSYFHFFKYPLKEEEIKQYLSITCTSDALVTALNELVKAGVVFNPDNFYTLDNDPGLVKSRLAGNKYAEIRLKKAYRIARFLGKFPFVDSIYISGSLSKDFSLPDGDLDYFIVTAPGRLWIARMLMHFFKKLTFLFNAQHSFCMNYYLGIENPEIEVKNYYTAIELVTLKPAYSAVRSDALFSANKQWVHVFLPNSYWESHQAKVATGKWTGTKIAEKLIDVFGGSRLNMLSYRFTRWKWIRKWKKKGYDVEECLKCMAPGVNTSINYPRNLMKIILEGYEEIYRKVEKNAMEKLDKAMVQNQVAREKPLVNN